MDKLEHAELLLKLNGFSLESEETDIKQVLKQAMWHPHEIDECINQFKNPESYQTVVLETTAPQPPQQPAPQQITAIKLENLNFSQELSADTIQSLLGIETIVDSSLIKTTRSRVVVESEKKRILLQMLVYSTLVGIFLIGSIFFILFFDLTLPIGG